MIPLPGELYLLFEDGEKRRPVVVVSREELNRGDYLLAVPLTTSRLQTRRALPNCVLLQGGKHGFSKECIAQAEALTLIAKGELALAEGPIGQLDDQTFREIIRAVGYVMDAECEPA